MKKNLTAEDIVISFLKVCCVVWVNIPFFYFCTSPAGEEFLVKKIRI